MWACCLAGAADNAGEASAASDGADIADAAGVCVPDRRKCARRPRRAALGARLLGKNSPQAGADAACAVRIGNDSADVCARTAVQRVVPDDVRRDGGDLRDNGADRPERAEKARLEGEDTVPAVRLRGGAVRRAAAGVVLVRARAAAGHCGECAAGGGDERAAPAGLGDAAADADSVAGGASGGGDARSQ